MSLKLLTYVSCIVGTLSSVFLLPTQGISAEITPKIQAVEVACDEISNASDKYKIFVGYLPNYGLTAEIYGHGNSKNPEKPLHLSVRMTYENSGGTVIRHYSDSPFLSLKVDQYGQSGNGLFGQKFNGLLVNLGDTKNIPLNCVITK